MDTDFLIKRLFPSPNHAIMKQITGGEKDNAQA